MNFYNSNCDWCFNPYGKAYNPTKQRFCSTRCRMAYHRAYKKYVTARGRISAAGPAPTVTQKKKRKRAKP